jgi:hypothetical protein
MCWRPRELLAEFHGPSCEIVSDLRPNPFSHDWHVQPNFQRPNHDPPERRAFSPAENSCRRACARPDSRGGCPYMCIPTVLETLQTYCAAKNPVNRGVPQNFHHFSTMGISTWGQPPSLACPERLGVKRGGVERVRSSEARQRGHSSTQQYGLPLGRKSEMALISACFFGRAKAEDRKLIKELALEVLTLKVPFRNLLLPCP